MTESPARIATVKMELDIAAPPGDVWRALTENIGDWWPADFYAGGSEGKRGFTLEAKPGGLMGEQWDGGGGVLWGTVVTADPEKSLQVLGHLFPNWGGPTQWYGTWGLEPRGKHTRLSFSETAMGQISEGGMQEKDKGWQFLWANLKANVEGKPAPAWPG